MGMTEEQRRLTLHCHLLVWVFGYNDFASFRSLMDETPERYTELAQFLNRVIFNQIATLGDVNLAMHGKEESDIFLSGSDNMELPMGHAPRDLLVRAAKECIAIPPTNDSFRRAEAPRSAVDDNNFAILMQKDLADLTSGENLHKCCATCHKGNHAADCR